MSSGDLRIRNESILSGVFRYTTGTSRAGLAGSRAAGRGVEWKIEGTEPSGGARREDADGTLNFTVKVYIKYFLFF